jgi:hypothetical protein
MKRHRVRGFQHGTDVPARSAPLGIGSAIESKEKKLAPALRITACNHRLPRSFRAVLCWQDFA